MTEKVSYIAFDGTEWRSSDLAQQHEKQLVTNWINAHPALVSIVKALGPDNGAWINNYGSGEEVSDREAFCQILLKAAVALSKLP